MILLDNNLMTSLEENLLSELDFENKISQRNFQNLKDVDFNDKATIEKIDKEVERSGYPSLDDLCQDLKKLDRLHGINISEAKTLIMRILGRKDATKQRISEKIAYNAITNVTIPTMVQASNGMIQFNETTLLPSKGKKALTIRDGEILLYSDPRIIKNSQPKSIDARWKFNIILDEERDFLLTVYASMKYTSSTEGGHQGNVESEISGYLHHASQNTDEHILFLALLDGEYWQHAKKNRKTKVGITRLDDYRTRGNKKTIACTSYDFHNVLIDYLNSL